MSRLISLLIVVAMLLVTGIAVANVAEDTSARKIALQQVYEHSNINLHLDTARQAIRKEVDTMHSSCTTDAKRPDSEKLLSEVMLPITLQQSFLAELNQRLDSDTLQYVLDWAASDVGKKIHFAENEEQLPDDELNKLWDNYFASDAFDRERKQLISLVIEKTGALYFVSAYHTERTALVTMAGVCENSDVEIASAEKVIKDDRGSEALYRAFLRASIIEPTAFAYRTLTNDDLKALIAFADTDNGKAYHAALIQSMRTVFASQVIDIRQKLLTMASTD